jgi:hypothetical protein
MNMSDHSGPNKDRDYEKIKRNYAKLLEAFNLPERPLVNPTVYRRSEQSKVEPLNKLLEEPEGKTHTSDAAAQSETPSGERRIEDLFTDVTHERAGWGFQLPGPRSVPASKPDRRKMLSQILFLERLAKKLDSFSINGMLGNITRRRGNYLELHEGFSEAEAKQRAEKEVLESLRAETPSFDFYDEMRRWGKKFEATHPCTWPQL